MKTHEIMQRIRNVRNLSRKEAAGIIGISNSYYLQLENGNRNPRPKMLLKIANSFNVPIDIFFKDENKQYLINSVVALIMMTSNDELQTLCSDFELFKLLKFNGGNK